VGPNGSGKSNVIDSMLFVFGFRAQKTRASKLSSMIHNSSTFPDVRMAKVAVHFQEIIDRGEDFEVVPNTQFSVARTVFKDKDSTSFYQIGNKKCKTKDVTKLLMDKGIDLDHNRFLILQGEVEQIALMKPKGLTENDKGMLEFLEDIVGTSRFKIPIEMLNKRVEELSELRMEKLNRVKLVEKEKDELEGPMKEALGYIKLENEKVEITHKQHQRHIVDSEKNIIKATEKKGEIEASVSDLNEKQKEIQDRKKEKQGEIKEDGKKYDKLQKELDENKERFDKFEKEDHGLREDMKNTNVKRKKIKQDAEAEKVKKEKLVNLPEENKAKIEECTEHRDSWEKKVEEKEVEYEAAMASLKSDTQVWQDEKAKHETKLLDLKKTVNEAAEELNLATNEHDVYVSEEIKAKLRLDDLINKIHNTKEQVKEKSKALDELNKLIPAKEKDLHNSRKENENVTGNYAQSNQRLNAMRAEYQEKKSAQTQAKSNGVVTDALMAQKKNGNIPGIIGRLGDLGGIDKKYDVAVSTAVSGLNTVLVDTAETGKKCIEFLRKSNTGRGNFLALEKAACNDNYKRGMQARQFPQNVPRLFDLIEPAEERFRPAFYHYMKDTLVAKDMEQARQVAYGATRYRVVDLMGNLIETSGTMSGGGGRPKSGLMGQQVQREVEVDPRELQNMEKGISQVDEEVQGLYRKKNQLEDNIHTLTNSLRDETKTQRKLDVEVNPLKAMIKELEGQVGAQEKQVKDAAPDKKRVAEMKKRITAAQGVYDKADDVAKVVQKEVKNCDVKIKEITGGKIKGIQKKKDEAVKKLEQFKSEITKLNVEIKSNERNLKKVNDKLENLEAEVKECEDSMTSMKARREEIEKEGSELLKNVEEKKEIVEGLKVTIGKLKKELDAVDKEETLLKSSRIEVDQQMQKWDDLVKENTNKVRYWKKELRKLSPQDVPGEETPELAELTEEQILELDMDALSFELNTITEKIAATKPNMAAIEEYNRKQKVK
jgi:structural maintenance of chromosome 4